MAEKVVKETWYQVKSRQSNIHEVQCSRSSGSYVWEIRKNYGRTDERRRCKVTSWDRLFATHDEARQYIIKGIERCIEEYQRDLETLPLLLSTARAELELWQNYKREEK